MFFQSGNYYEAIIERGLCNKVKKARTDRDARRPMPIKKTKEIT